MMHTGDQGGKLPGFLARKIWRPKCSPTAAERKLLVEKIEKLIGLEHEGNSIIGPGGSSGYTGCGGV